MAFVKTEVQGAVEIITIDRPKALNALNPEVLADLKAAFEAVDQEAIRCIVLTGEGDKSFVAGADIGSMSTMTKAEGEAFGKLGNDVFLMIEHFPIPVIAAVNGFALGGGNELAMSCDIRICSDNAVFGQPEVGLGITPGFGGTQRLARLVGMGMAKQLVYSALNIKADEALRIGLVNAVYPLEELMPAFGEKTRYNIRLSARKGVTTRWAGAEALETFFRIYLETCERDGIGHRPLDYFQRMLEAYGPERCRVCLAEYEGEPLAAAIALHYGRKVFYIYGASSNEKRNLMPAYAMQAEMIRWACSLGVDFYDLGGVYSLSKENRLRRSARRARKPCEKIKPYFLRRARSFCSRGLPRRKAQYQNGESTWSNSPASSVTPTEWQKPSLKR